ncbi:c-type cytochrome [Psychromonas hadalis]|uniref:c-type cytochrome n=1 Tax=Psychromonas hadalis TaxID=211669 RepID=UPI0003B48859|nr:cytochrome c [Psychromonas hadalis]
MQLKITFIIILLSLSSAVVNAQMPVGDANLGPLKTPSCRFCHGQDGIGTQDTYPNLAGQKSAYLFSSMKIYQSGMRSGGLATMMSKQLSRLNDQDLADISAYYEKMAKE